MSGGAEIATRAVAREWKREWKIEGHFTTRDDSGAKRARAIACGSCPCGKDPARLERIAVGRVVLDRLRDVD